MRKKRLTYRAAADACRAAVAEAQAKFDATPKGTIERQDAYGALSRAQQELRDAERKLRERQRRDRERKAAQPEGQRERRRPLLTLDQKVESLRATVADRRENIAAMEPGTDAWHRAVSSLRKKERELEKLEGFAAGFD